MADEQIVRSASGLGWVELREGTGAAPAAGHDHRLAGCHAL